MMQLQSIKGFNSPTPHPSLYSKWFTHDNCLSLQGTDGAVTPTQEKQENTISHNHNPIHFLKNMKNTVLFPTNVSFDNTLQTIACVKEQHLKGMIAYLTASVYMLDASGKRSSLCSTRNELSRILFYEEPSLASTRRRNLPTLLIKDSHICMIDSTILRSLINDWLS